MWNLSFTSGFLYFRTIIVFPLKFHTNPYNFDAAILTELSELESAPPPPCGFMRILACLISKPCASQRVNTKAACGITPHARSAKKHIKVVLHGTACKNDFPRNTASTFRSVLNESTFRATSYKMFLATCMLHETIFSTTPTRNISHARPGHVEQNFEKVLREKSTATLLHESTF